MQINFWDNFSKLPQELKDIIWSYVDVKIKVFTCKPYYQKFHKLIITPFKFDTYLRNIIKFDLNFVLSQVLKDEEERILKNRKIYYRFKNYRFNSYINYLHTLIQEYNSKKCQNIFLEWISNKNICKNSFKKKKRDNKWTN